MKTRRRFMEEDSMDVGEVAAVERRNFLSNRCLSQTQYPHERRNRMKATKREFHHMHQSPLDKDNKQQLT